MNQSDIKRTRTITWDNPHEGARKAGSISGLDYLRAIRDGKISPPPAAMLIGYRIVHVEEGRTVFELDPGEYHYNPFASVHGGIAATLLDSAMTSAVMTVLPVGLACSTIDIHVSFIRPIRDVTGTVRCEAMPVHVGSRIATARGELKDGNEKLYAHGVSTCMIFHA